MSYPNPSQGKGDKKIEEKRQKEKQGYKIHTSIHGRDDEIINENFLRDPLIMCARIQSAEEVSGVFWQPVADVQELIR